MAAAISGPLDVDTALMTYGAAACPILDDATTSCNGEKALRSLRGNEEVDELHDQQRRLVLIMFRDDAEAVLEEFRRRCLDDGVPSPGGETGGIHQNDKLICEGEGLPLQ